MLAAAAEPPNIILVLTDDLDAPSISFMPEVRALAERGTTFTNAFTVSPICAPARATLLTGKYPQNTGVRSNRLPAGGYQPFYASGQEEETLAVWLNTAGYRTALVGKYLNDYPLTAPAMHIPKGWDHWVAAVSNGDMHAKYNYTLNEDGKAVSYGAANADYSTDVLAAKARAFVHRAAKAGGPFALYFSPPSPHVKEFPAPRHGKLFPDLRAPRLASFPERDTSDKPPFMRLPMLDAAQVATIDERFRARVRMLQSIDEAMGSLRRLLERHDLLKNTYVVFTSDHGWHQGEHNQMPGKGRPYDEDVRVPLIVAGPGVPAGRKISRLVGIADLAPTMADWAGAKPGPAVDGRSFAPLLRAARPALVPWRKRLPIMRTIEGTSPTVPWPRAALERGTKDYSCLDHLPPDDRLWPEYRGVRTERHTYVEYVTGDRELYDDVYDPRQLVNRICRAGTKLLRQMENAVDALSTCRGAACRRAEDW